MGFRRPRWTRFGWISAEVVLDLLEALVDGLTDWW